MEQEPTKNAINNYKGVMLCSRPNQNKQPEVEKPFCARVIPPDALGLLPFKKVTQIKYQKKSNPIVEKHKKWLEEFKIKQIIKKQQSQQQQQRQKQRLEKIKFQAQVDRQKSRKMKQQYNSISKNVLSILDDNGDKNKKNQLNAQNLRKLNQLTSENSNSFKKQKKNTNQKPIWAQTQKEVQKKEAQQVDELLDFFQNTDVEKFMDDTQVNVILKSLKQKIQNIKRQQNWKQKQIAKAKQMKNNDDTQKQMNQQNKSQYSLKSEGGKSVASQKSTKRIQQLQQKIQKKKEGHQDWDKYSKNSKNNFSTYEQKIAKNVADQVLRSYGNFKGVHSNISIRKLLEKQAARQLMEPHPRPIITTVFKDKAPLDMNNLPYLHRNPAV